MQDKLKQPPNHFEKYLQDLHASQYIGIDDDMPDDYDRWIQELDIEDLIQYGHQYAWICSRYVASNIKEKLTGCRGYPAMVKEAVEMCEKIERG